MFRFASGWTFIALPCFTLSRVLSNKKAEANFFVSAFFEKLAATYSRGVYKTTTIGKTVFDGRVRNGIGSDHSFMATKKCDGWRVASVGGKTKSEIRMPKFERNPKSEIRIAKAGQAFSGESHRQTNSKM